MKKLFLLLLLVILQVSIIGCTPERIPDEPVVVKPVEEIPANDILKPAIRNIGNKKKTAKTTGKTAGTIEVRKLLVKSIQYANNKVNTNYKYILDNMTLAEYRLLPSDNLYEPKEEALNINTEVSFNKEYLYNSQQQMISESTTYILDPKITEPTKTYSYDALGNLSQIFETQYSTYTYNSEGLIASKLNKNTKALEFTYTYDNQGRILDVYHYQNTPTGQEKDMHYVYSYPDVNFYTKTWYSINTVTKIESRVEKVIFQYDPTKPGVYNKEPIYQLENQYMHIVKITQEPNTGAGWFVFPKYFYDEEGYLRKYDAAGLNRTVDIIVFKYE